jgi:hypothetical protein
MPGKRARYARAMQLHCPYCEARIYRLNSQRYSLVQERAGSHRGRDSAAHSHCWVEEFYCTEDGRMWLLLERVEATGQVRSQLPGPDVWKRTVGTIDPNHTNPSVSEFSLRHSRGSDPRVIRRSYG